MDATRLAPRLYQGSYPRDFCSLRARGFTLLTLCAEELQPPRKVLCGTKYLRVPLDDDASRPVSTEEWDAVLAAAFRIASHVQRGGRALTTCAAGLNRSGITNAATLCMLTGQPGTKVVRHIQRERPGALSNRRFVERIVDEFG